MKSKKMYWFPDYNTGEPRVLEDRVFSDGKLMTMQIVDNELIIIYEGSKSSQLRKPVTHIQPGEYFCHVVIDNKEYKLSIKWDTLVKEYVQDVPQKPIELKKIVCLFRVGQYKVKLSNGKSIPFYAVWKANKGFFDSLEGMSMAEVENILMGIDINPDTLEIVTSKDK